MGFFKMFLILFLLVIKYDYLFCYLYKYRFLVVLIKNKLWNELIFNISVFFNLRYVVFMGRFLGSYSKIIVNFFWKKFNKIRNKKYIRKKFCFKELVILSLFRNEGFVIVIVFIIYLFF